VEFSFDQSSSDKSTIGSDRLRKAIERNRAKQARRSSKTSSVVDTSWAPPMGASAPKGPTRKTVAQAGDVEFTSTLRKGVNKSPANVSYSSPGTSAGTTRTRVAKTRALARKQTKSVSRTRRKTVIEPNRYLVRGIWIFCAFLLLRLVFSAGGIIDYYEKKEVLARKVSSLERVKEENSDLVKEIEKIKNNASYQKKIVRKHLGHIAKDEYLVLFSD